MSAEKQDDGWLVDEHGRKYLSYPVAGKYQKYQPPPDSKIRPPACTDCEQWLPGIGCVNSNAANASTCSWRPHPNS